LAEQKQKGFTYHFPGADESSMWVMNSTAGIINRTQEYTLDIMARVHKSIPPYDENRVSLMRLEFDPDVLGFEELETKVYLNGILYPSTYVETLGGTNTPEKEYPYVIGYLVIDTTNLPAEEEKGFVGLVSIYLVYKLETAEKGETN
jgi:hypothetical protein